jgi:2,4-dienoyl-CoA reductase-like NADH-dependent reductase (Old Yellow Enzyme family)
MSKLFTPISIKNLVLKNKIVVSPMCQYSANDGYANNWHLVHLGSRAVGGAAAIIQEATAVSPEGRITYGDVGLWKDEHIAPLKNIVDFIHQNGSIAGVQLAHAGRKASCEKPWLGGKQIKEEPNGWQTVSSSSFPFFETDNAPHELSIPEIKNIVLQFKQATQRAINAGYKIIEIHAAHGYLIHQFFSPLSNKRNDEYGGSFENRIKLLLEIIDEVNTVITKDVSLWVRISASDWIDGGWDIQQSVDLVKILQTKNVDVSDTSSGGVVPHAKIPVAKNYQVPFAKQIKSETGIITGTVGFIIEAHQAEEILQNNEADLIFIGREFLRNPYFPLHAAEILKDNIDWLPQYVRAKKERL